MNDEPLPIKSLGQHWLNDPETLNSICDLAEINNRDTVLEVGPGLGSLSDYLVDRAKKVIAVEFDDHLADMLKVKFVNHANMEVINQDIRKYDLRQLEFGYKCVANIPYYLTSYLIRLLSESINPPAMAVLLIQREVAQRLSAQPGQLSVIAVITQVFWEIELGTVVPRKLFLPPPEVDSQIIKLVRRKDNLVSNDTQKIFFQTVRVGFSQKRKTLANSLSSGFRITKAQAQQFLDQAEINPKSRPQELSIEDWQRLTIAIHNK